jgi:hypothetical protein
MAKTTTRTKSGDVYLPEEDAMVMETMNSTRRPDWAALAVRMKALGFDRTVVSLERWAWPDGVTEDDLPDVYPGWSSALHM